MKNMDEILNNLVAKLLAEGSAQFSQDGLNIKTSYDNGCFKLAASFESPVVDETSELVKSFEEYVKSLSDDFFVEVTESFKDGELKSIQDKLDSKKPNLVRLGIDHFMARLKATASSKISDLNADIATTERELTELIEIRDSYMHVLNKKF